MKKTRFIFTLTLTLLLLGAASAQSQTRDSVAFNPHFYLQPQVGVGLHTGETTLDGLISPAAALSLGYQFSPVLGLRLGASGWEARNEQAHPMKKYKWNYVQGNLDVTLSLLNLLCGKRPARSFDVYAFLGGGVNYAFNNDDAVALAAAGGRYEKLWTDHRWSPTVRGGLGLDLRLSERLVLGLEGNTNLMQDHFNSKKGKHDNRDWQTNVLLGLKIALGKPVRHFLIEPPVQPAPEPEPVVVAEPEPVKPEPVKPVEVKYEPMEVEVFFTINSSVIRESESAKLDALVRYLDEHPAESVDVTGYADRPTGNPTINMRLSRKRAETVMRYLITAGIAPERIETDAKGDTEQPHQTQNENRVVICITSK